MPGHPLRGHVLWLHNAMCFGAAASVWNLNGAGSASPGCSCGCWADAHLVGKDGVTLSPTQQQIDKLNAIVGGVLHTGSCTPKEGQRQAGKINLPNQASLARWAVRLSARYTAAASIIAAFPALRSVLRDTPARFIPLKTDQVHTRRCLLPRGRGLPQSSASADTNISTGELHHRHPPRMAAGGHAGRLHLGILVWSADGLEFAIHGAASDLAMLEFTLLSFRASAAAGIAPRPAREIGASTQPSAEPAISHRKKCGGTFWIRDCT